MLYIKYYLKWWPINWNLFFTRLQDPSRVHLLKGDKYLQLHNCPWKRLDLNRNWPLESCRTSSKYFRNPLRLNPQMLRPLLAFWKPTCYCFLVSRDFKSPKEPHPKCNIPDRNFKDPQQPEFLSGMPATKHALRKKEKEKFIGLKLDMSTAYDHIEWDFLDRSLKCPWFSSRVHSYYQRCIVGLPMGRA